MWVCWDLFAASGLYPNWVASRNRRRGPGDRHRHTCLGSFAVAAGSKLRLAMNLPEEINQEFADTGGFFVLEPVGSLGEGDEFGLRAITKAVLRHFG